MAEVNTADGTFDVVTSHEYGDGIVRGKHKVHIQAFDEQNQPSRAVPSEYSHPQKTPLEVDSADSPYHFKVKKPQ